MPLLAWETPQAALQITVEFCFPILFGWLFLALVRNVGHGAGGDAEVHVLKLRICCDVKGLTISLNLILIYLYLT